MQMEALYTKLHDKYTELKMKKYSEMEQFNREQEEKFLNYMTAAEEMIEHLKNVNERLLSKIDDLTNQMTSDRSSLDSRYSEYQNLLIEEKEKTKNLSEEVERLHNQLSERFQSGNNDDDNVEGLLSPKYQVSSRDLSKGSAQRKTVKPYSGNVTEDTNVIPNASIQEVQLVQHEPAKDENSGMQSNGAVKEIQLPCSCSKDMTSSGDGRSNILHVNCVFQTLVECLVGMKFSIVNQTGGFCLSVIHQSSGYSFSLTWVKSVAGEETELLYHVLSLGTFERVAPEWMREDLMFSLRMCAVFFQRVSQITRLHT